MALKNLECKNCGAQISFDASIQSLKCDFCGSNTVIEHDVVEHDENLPQFLIPFKVEKNKATDIFREWTQKGLFVKSDFKTSVRQGKFEGVYIPFWRYAADTHSSWNGENGQTKYRTVTKTKTVDGKEETYQEEEAYTEYYPVNGTLNRNYIDYITASKGLSQKEADKLLPVNENERVNFDSNYLSGWKAEIPQIHQEVAENQARTRVKEMAREDCSHECDRLTSCSTTITSEDTSLSTLPIWIFAFFYNNNSFRAVINGQTGQIWGPKPISAIKVIIAVLIGLAIAAAGIFIYFALTS